MERQRLQQIPIEILRARVAQEIRTAILSGHLPPGCRVTQEELATQLGVSREPVRHALLELQREGLVQAQRNRRAVVATLERDLISDLYGFREGVETSVAAGLARLRHVDLLPARDIIRRGRIAVRQGDLPALIELDMSFHSFLYEAAENAVLVDVMQSQWSHLRRVMAMLLGRAASRQKLWDQHEEILEAILAHRPKAAGAAAGRHVRAAGEMVLKLFDAAAVARNPIEKGQRNGQSN